jgi:hypothetical protein
MIKSTIQDTTKKINDKFPLFKKHITAGVVVMFFTDRSNGCVVYSDDTERPVGYYSDAWLNYSDCNWEEFHGSITLTQE